MICYIMNVQLRMSFRPMTVNFDIVSHSLHDFDASNICSHCTISLVQNFVYAQWFQSLIVHHVLLHNDCDLKN